jgi:hypothetical protein
MVQKWNKWVKSNSMSKEQWQASFEKSIQEKTQLESKRLDVFNEVTALNEQLEQLDTWLKVV